MSDNTLFELIAAGVTLVALLGTFWPGRSR